MLGAVWACAMRAGAAGRLRAGPHAARCCVGRRGRTEKHAVCAIHGAVRHQRHEKQHKHKVRGKPGADCGRHASETSVASACGPSCSTQAVGGRAGGRERTWHGHRLRRARLRPAAVSARAQRSQAGAAGSDGAAAARAPLAPAPQRTALGDTVSTGTALAPPPEGGCTTSSRLLPPRFQESLETGSTAQQSSSRPPNSRMARPMAAGSRAAAPRPARAGARRSGDARVCEACSTRRKCAAARAPRAPGMRAPALRDGDTALAVGKEGASEQRSFSSSTRPRADARRSVPPLACD